MKLTVVGSTGSMSGAHSAASCYLVQASGFDPELGRDRVYSMVMDMGPGAFGQLTRYLDPRELDAVLISHGHADHLADIISLQVYLKWHPDGESKGMRVAGPAELPHRVMQIEGYKSDPAEFEAFDYVAVDVGAEMTVGPMRVTAFPGLHPVESYGFRIEGPSSNGGTDTVVIAYTGDTDLCEGMVEMANGADLLLSECGFTDQVEVRGVHLTGTRAAELARDAGVGQLVLTHIQPWTDPAIPVSEARAVLDSKPQVAVPGASWTV